MRAIYLLSLAAAALAAGCAPRPAEPTAVAPAGVSRPDSAPLAGASESPTGRAAAAPPGAPTADPIVGDWKMDQEQFTLYMRIKSDGKTAINLEKTRASLDLLTRKLLEKTPPEPAKRAQAEMVFKASMDKQIALLAEYRGNWKRQGDYYRMESYSSSIDKEPSITYARVDGEKLVSTDAKGTPKAGEPPAWRDPG